MTTRLEKLGAVFEIQQIGRALFVSEGGVETTEQLFDADEARREVDARIAARIADGWAEPADVVAARGAAATRRAELDARLRELADTARADPRAAVRTFSEGLFTPQAFDRLIERIASVDSIDARGFTIHFASGASAHWHATPTQRLADLWLYLDAAAAARNDQQLYYGDDAGPPEGDAQLAGTALEGSDLLWFLQELPWDRYWLVAGGVVHELDLHTGLRSPPRAIAPLDLVVERIVALLDR